MRLSALIAVKRLQPLSLWYKERATKFVCNWVFIPIYDRSDSSHKVKSGNACIDFHLDYASIVSDDP